MRDYLRRLRREAIRRRRITEPPPPTCDVCGRSLAQGVIVRAYKGETECAACADARREYHRAHGGGVSVIRITESATRKELQRQRREDRF